MNPWWRRPAAEDGSARPESAGASAPVPAAQKKEQKDAQTEEPAAETAARAVAEAARGSAADGTARFVDASALLVDTELSVGDADAGDDADDSAPSPGSDWAVQEKEAPGPLSSDREDAGEGHVSPVLDAGIESAQPVEAAPAAADRPAPARRRRRRRRGRRGRGRGRGRAPQPDEPSDAAEKAAPAPAARPGASRPRAGRAAALLDLSALKRDLGKGAVLDPEGLFALLDGELGKLVLRRVYADAGDRHLDRAALHRGGAEVVDVPSHTQERGCSAAVRIVVDALELCYTMRGIGIMVLAASSVQMLPLVAKLQQNGVTVIGLGGAGANAQVRSQCDRFIGLG